MANKKEIKIDAKVVNCTAVYLRKAPEKTKDNSVAVIAAGTVVKVVQEIYDAPVANLGKAMADQMTGVSDWYKVTTAGGQTGYIMKEYLELQIAG